MKSAICLVVLAVGIWQAESFAAKRLLDPKQLCFASATAKLYLQYTKNEEGAQLIRAAFTECMKEAGKEEECLNEKKSTFEKSFGHAEVAMVENILQGVASIDFVFRGHCCGLEGTQLEECNKRVYDGFVTSPDCGTDCQEFVKVVDNELKNCEADEHLPAQRSFTGFQDPLGHLRAVMKSLKKYKK